MSTISFQRRPDVRKCQSMRYQASFVTCAHCPR